MKNIIFTCCLLLLTASISLAATAENNKKNIKCTSNNRCFDKFVVNSSEPIRMCLIEKTNIFEVADNTVHIVTIDQLEQMLQCAYNQTLLVLFNTLIIELKQKQIRLRISGDTFRTILKTYFLGGKEVHAIFPLRELMYLEFGHASIGIPEFHVILKRVPEPYVEKVNFLGNVAIVLSKEYGFYTVETYRFSDSFGVNAVRGKLKKKLSYIKLDNNFEISIFVENFIFPKRWFIDIIRLRSE